jgi:hypothetical protein
VGISLISTSQPTAFAYLLSVLTEGECFPAPSSREIALLVVPIEAATSSWVSPACTRAVSSSRTSKQHGLTFGDTGARRRRPDQSLGAGQKTTQCEVVPPLPPQRDINPGEHQLQLGVRQSAYRFGESSAVQRHGLRDVRDGILGKAGEVRGQENVPWRIRPVQIPCEWHAHNRANAAAIERVPLNHNEGTTVRRFRAQGAAKIGPVHVAL